MKRLGLLLVMALALAVTLPAGMQAADDPVVIHQRIIDAVNRGDIQEAAKYFSDDVVITGGFTCAPAPCNTPAAVQREMATWASQNVRITRYSASSFVGELTSWEEHRADIVRAAGVDRVIVNVTAKFWGGKFVSYNIKPDTRDQQTARFIEYVTRQAATGGASATTGVTVTTGPSAQPGGPAAGPGGPARPPAAPARLPSTGSGPAIATTSGAGWMALGIVLSALFATGLTLRRTR